MTRTNVTAAWIAILVIGLVKATALEGDFRDRTSNVQFRIVTETLQNNDGRVRALANGRMFFRQRAEQWEEVATFAAVSSGIAAVAITASGLTWWFLMAASVGFATRAGYFVSVATGITLSGTVNAFLQAIAGAFATFAALAMGVL